MGKTRQENKITYLLQMSTLGVSFYLQKPIKCHLSVLFQCVIISIVSGNNGNVLIIIIWERYLLLSLDEGSLEYLKFPLLRLNFFNTPATYFLKYFRGKFREILTSGSRKSYSAFNRNLLTYYACAALNWVLSVAKKNLRIAGFFASIPFLTYFCNKTLKLSIYCVQLWGNIAQIVWALSK